MPNLIASAAAALSLFSEWATAQPHTPTATPSELPSLVPSYFPSGAVLPRCINHRLSIRQLTILLSPGVIFHLALNFSTIVKYNNSAYIIFASSDQDIDAITTTIGSRSRSEPNHYNNKTEVVVAVCGGTVKQEQNANVNANPNEFISTYAVNSCNEAYTMKTDWVVEIHDDRAGPIDVIDHLEDGYCKKSALESWGVVAYKDTKKKVKCGFDTIPWDITCNSYRPPEYHAFVLWDPSGWELFENFIKRSKLVEVVDTLIVNENNTNHTEWCLSIYGGNKERIALKKNCHPYGDSKVVVVRDLAPIYLKKNALKKNKTKARVKGEEVLNKHMWEMKWELRLLFAAIAKREKKKREKKKKARTKEEAFLQRHYAQGYMAVHSSTYVEETYLVLEPLNYMYGPPPAEFDSAKDIFNLLDNYKCFQYVVLHSHEEVNEGLLSTDVDILVNDYFMFKAITGARSNSKTKMREMDNGPNTQNTLGGKWRFNVRYVGDRYYDTAWQLRMLQLRVRSSPGGVWIQEPVSYAMSLLYHSNVHKSPTATISPSSWNTIHQTLPLLTEIRSLRSRTALQTYMTAHGYNVTKPHDINVQFHK